MPDNDFRSRRPNEEVIAGGIERDIEPDRMEENGIEPILKEDRGELQDVLSTKVGEINNRLWQQAVDMACEKNNLGDIKILQMIRPACVPRINSIQTAAANSVQNIPIECANVPCEDSPGTILLQELYTGTSKTLEKLERKFGMHFHITPEEAQVYFARLLIGFSIKSAYIQKEYHLLVNRSHALPNHEIIGACYWKIFNDSISPKEDSLELFKLVNILPSEGLTQKLLRSLFTQYVQTLPESEHDVLDSNYRSQQILIKIENIIEFTGYKQQFSNEDAKEWYRYCLTHDPSLYQKIPTIKLATGFDLDAEDIQTLILDNKNVISRVPIDISQAQLVAHLAKPENAGIEEHARMCTVFDAITYSQNLVTGLDRDVKEGKFVSADIMDGAARQTLSTVQRTDTKSATKSLEELIQSPLCHEDIKRETLDHLLNHQWFLWSDARELLEEAQNYNRENSLTCSAEEYLRLGKNSVSIESYKKLIERKMTPREIAEYPWLLQLEEGMATFPFRLEDGEKPQQLAWKQREWCAQYAFCHPDGWDTQGLGRIILTRLQKGVDRSVHNASFWLKKFENKESQKWVTAHMLTPHRTLTYAWGCRKDALEDGVPDNPTAICAWGRVNALKSAMAEMTASGTLPKNISQNDLVIYKEWIEPLISHYDGGEIISFLSFIKRYLNKVQDIPAAALQLEEGRTGEILEKADPQGATIGPETGCCMTLGGVSESCIKTGYTKPFAGFFALKDERKRLVAQSFLWVNETESPDILVVDNIEKSSGKDADKIRTSYVEFFEKYLREQKKQDPTFQLRKVYLGEGYSSVGMDNLQKVTSIPVPYSGYSDAEKQRLLLEIPEQEFFALNPLDCSLHNPAHTSWNEIREEVLAIEQMAFQGKGDTETDLEEGFSNPKNCVTVLRENGRIIGYCLAVPKSEKTLYVSSTALLPEYQKKGLVRHLLTMLDREARNRHFLYYIRDTKVEEGYADVLEKHYEVLSRGKERETPYGKQRFLRLAIPGVLRKKNFDSTGTYQENREQIA